MQASGIICNNIFIKNKCVYHYWSDGLENNKPNNRNEKSSENIYNYFIYNVQGCI